MRRPANSRAARLSSLVASAWAAWACTGPLPDAPDTLDRREAAAPNVLAVELPAPDDPAPELRVQLEGGRSFAFACARPKREYCRGTGADEHEWVVAGDHLWAICGRQVRALSLRDGSTRDVYAVPGEIKDVATLIADAEGHRFGLRFVGPALIGLPGEGYEGLLAESEPKPEPVVGGFRRVMPPDPERFAKMRARSEAAQLEPSVVVFDDRGRELWSTKEYSHTMALSPDGRWLARTFGGQLEFVELDTGQVRTPKRAADQLAFVGNRWLLWTGRDAGELTIERMRLADGHVDVLLRWPRDWLGR